MNLASNRQLVFFSLIAVSPFAGLLAGVTHPRDRISRNLVWVFTIFYGAVFYISDTSGADSVRYAEQLRIMHTPGFTFSDLAAQFFSGANSYQDFYQPLITFVVSRITGETWLLFGVFGILLGYVYSRNIWFLIDRLGVQDNQVIAYFIVVFALIVEIGAALNGVRMWTALHVFVFGVLHYSDGKRLKFLIAALAAPLIHFSFLLPCAMLLVFLAVRRFGFGIYIFFLISFVAANLDLAVVRTVIDYLPFTMEDRAKEYVDLADPAALTISGLAWFLTLNNILVSTFVFLASTWLFVRGSHNADSTFGVIYLFGMLIYGATNLVAYVPSAARFYSIGEMLIVAALVLFLADKSRVNKRDRQVAMLLAPLLLINVAIGARLFLEFASLYTLIGNFFMAPFVSADQGLYEIVKLF